jgi:hypothetical protein
MEDHAMQLHSAIPDEIASTWIHDRDPHHPPGQHREFHYHDVEEWLKVLEGNISFFTLGHLTYDVGVGQVLAIPRGEVHEVQVGPQGVTYEMWLPVPVPDKKFANYLSAEELELLSDNLDFPRREEVGDARFFDHILSNQLTFCGADGAVLGKAGFIGKGFETRRRKSSGSVRVLNRSSGSFLCSTVVTVPSPEGQPLAFTNLRLFVKEADGLKCRVWINYPEGMPRSAELVPAG